MQAKHKQIKRNYEWHGKKFIVLSPVAVQFMGAVFEHTGRHMVRYGDTMQVFDAIEGTGTEIRLMWPVDGGTDYDNVEGWLYSGMYGETAYILGDISAPEYWSIPTKKGIVIGEVLAGLNCILPHAKNVPGGPYNKYALAG